MNTHKQLISLMSTRGFLGRPLRSTLLTSALSLVVGLAACGPAGTTADDASQNPAAIEEVATAAGETATKVYVEDGVAIGGADAVAYFSTAGEGDFVPGSAEYTHEWLGATWQFASAENRDAFAANPEQYAPQYGGHCAWAAAQDAIAAIDPSAWKVVDGRLYLNLNKKIQARWEKDIPGNIAKADTNWPALAAQ